MATEDDPLVALRAKLALKPLGGGVPVPAPAPEQAPALVEIVAEPVVEPALATEAHPAVVLPEPGFTPEEEPPDFGGASLEPLSADDISLLKVEKKAELEAEKTAEPIAPPSEALPPEVASPASEPMTSETSPAVKGTIEVLLVGDTIESLPVDPLPPVEFSPSLVIEMGKVKGAPEAKVQPPPEPKPASPPFTFFLPKIAVPAPEPVKPTPAVKSPSTSGAVVKPAVAAPLPKQGFFLKGPAAMKEEKEQKERRLLEEALKVPIEELAAQDRINACLALLRDARKGNDSFQTRFFGDLGRVRLFSWGIIALLLLAIGLVGLLHGTVKQLNGRIESLQSELGEVRKRLPPAWEMDCRLADVDKDWARGCVPRAITKPNP